jgi:hypothetical protein
MRRASSAGIGGGPSIAHSRHARKKPSASGYVRVMVRVSESQPLGSRLSLHVTKRSKVRHRVRQTASASCKTLCIWHSTTIDSVSTLVRVESERAGRATCGERETREGECHGECESSSVFFQCVDLLILPYVVQFVLSNRII